MLTSCNQKEKKLPCVSCLEKKNRLQLSKLHSMVPEQNGDAFLLFIQGASI